MSGSVSYQMFETYYNRAREAESAGRMAEAKKMYLLASEAVLKSAKEVSGETKAALVRRADKLRLIADAIDVSEAPAAGDSGEQEDKEPRSERKRGEKQDGEASSVWTAAGKPNVHFDDIAGLEDVKESIRRRVILPRLHPEVYKEFKRNVSGGILLYGPPGTGKTMIAKAVACEVDADFFSVRCSDIVGKYFGEAEKNVKALFEAARKAKSAVIFFDEFEALAGQRGSDSPVMNRLVPELLSQMDGFSASDEADILFLAATNRPWDIDTAFMRPPRLTQKVYIGLPDYEARLFLAKRALEGVPCESGVTPELAAEKTDGYNAADIVSFCEQLKDDAIERTIASGEKSPISMDDFRRTLQKARSSVQQRDIDQIREWESAQQ